MMNLAVTAGSGTDEIRFIFTGAPYFSGPGLYQMGARYFNPAVGRFITRDSYKGNIYRPWTQNLYTYCHNNPVNFIDPTGHQEASNYEGYNPDNDKFNFVGTWELIKPTGEDVNAVVTMGPVGGTGNYVIGKMGKIERSALYPV